MLQPRNTSAPDEITRKSLVADLNVHLLTARNLWEQLRGRATEKAVGHVQVVAATSDRMLSMGQTLIELARAQMRETSLATAALTMNEGGAEGRSGKMRVTVKALKVALAQKGLDTSGTRDDLLRRLNLASLGEGIPNGAGGASFVAGAAAKPGAVETSAQR